MSHGERKWQPQALRQALEHEVILEATKSSGPGGQKVNKTESAIVLRWNLQASFLFTDETKIRLQNKLLHRTNKMGEVVIKTQVHRDQYSNKQESLDQLVALVLQALIVPLPRKKTKPKYSAIVKRLKEKRKHSEHKKNRSQKTWDSDGD